MQPEPPPVIGVTGPVAAGKSALSKRLGTRGAHVVDVDALGHRALASAEVRDAVVLAFGASILGENGSLDRARLARVAFADSEARRRLEAIVHPVVRRDIDAEIRKAARVAAPAVVIDCALLFESGLEALCDLTVDVDAPDDVRFARALEAHGWDEGEVRRRMAAQLPAEVKRARADRVFVNDGDGARLDLEAERILEQVTRSGPAAATTRRARS